MGIYLFLRVNYTNYLEWGKVPTNYNKIFIQNYIAKGTHVIPVKSTLLNIFSLKLVALRFIIL